MASHAGSKSAKANMSLPDDLESRKYDIIVYEATPGGVACAVRAAREGLDVLLVNHTHRLGGMIANGLSVWDTLYEGRRSPVYDELRQAMFDHYRTTYGEDSEQYRNAIPGTTGHTNGRFEARVAEKLVGEMLALEPRITVVTGFYPVDAVREARQIKSVTFQELNGERRFTSQARLFADCSYEGDLAAAAKTPYRVGRESRDEFNEPHAGRVFIASSSTAPSDADPQQLADFKRLNIRHFGSYQRILPQSTGEADGNVQAFNMRTVLSSDPENRILPKRPDDYDPAQLKHLEFASRVQPLPNRKMGWNRPQLIGLQTEYVEGNWETRHKVIEQHKRATLALLYFLQNDESVPEPTRQYWRQYGLAKDEFPENGHFPNEIYVREARRIEGRYVFTQHDAMWAKGLRRAPVHADSIGVTEWYMDSHACTAEHVTGSMHEGKMVLHKETVPGQVSYRALLPKDLDNLLVPICLSSTHVAWGTIRLEPT